ncbi:hypothetical protein SUDANB23_01542 [Streptomyces sp. enrichment culture]
MTGPALPRALIRRVRAIHRGEAHLEPVLPRRFSRSLACRIVDQLRRQVGHHQADGVVSRCRHSETGPVTGRVDDVRRLTQQDERQVINRWLRPRGSITDELECAVGVKGEQPAQHRLGVCGSRDGWQRVVEPASGPWSTLQKPCPRSLDVRGLGHGLTIQQPTHDGQDLCVGAAGKISGRTRSSACRHGHRRWAQPAPSSTRPQAKGARGGRVASTALRSCASCPSRPGPCGSCTSKPHSSQRLRRIAVGVHQQSRLGSHSSRPQALPSMTDAM